jgi:hypothetical protein
MVSCYDVLNFVYKCEFPVSISKLNANIDTALIWKKTNTHTFSNQCIMSMLAQDILAEQSGEGPGKGEIARSVNLTLSFGIEQSGAGPGNGGKTRSITGGKGVKRKKERKQIYGGKVCCYHRM